MRIIIACLLLVLIGLQYKLWMGDGSVLQWMQLQKKLTLQQEKNQQLEARNRVIEANIRELHSGEQALEEQARFELGMVKEGEVYYHFID